MCINAFKTKWIVVKTNNSISATQKKQLQEINSTCKVIGNDVVFVLSIGKTAEEIQQEVIILKPKITDKQYSLINHNWVKQSFPDLTKPFSHAILAQDFNMKSTIPVSDFQFKNRKQF
jgi:hypothetical protein